jgi:hypothetical protein
MNGCRKQIDLIKLVHRSSGILCLSICTMQIASTNSLGSLHVKTGHIGSMYRWLEFGGGFQSVIQLTTRLLAQSIVNFPVLGNVFAAILACCHVQQTV